MNQQSDTEKRQAMWAAVKQVGNNGSTLCSRGEGRALSETELAAMVLAWQEYGSAMMAILQGELEKMIADRKAQKLPHHDSAHWLPWYKTLHDASLAAGDVCSKLSYTLAGLYQERPPERTVEPVEAPPADEAIDRALGVA